MRRTYDEVGVGTVSVPPALRNQLEESNSRRIRIGEPSARISMPPTYRILTTPQGLRNGQMISATENFTDVLARSREQEALDRQHIYKRVSDFLAGYYSYDSEKYAEEQSALQQHANVEKAQMMATDPDYEEPEVLPQEARPKPRAVVTQTEEVAKFVNNAIKEMEEAGIPVAPEVRLSLKTLTPALLQALKQGYTSQQGMRTAITRFRNNLREAFTEEHEAKIRELTSQNLEAQRQSETLEARSTIAEAESPPADAESPLNTAGFHTASHWMNDDMESPETSAYTERGNAFRPRQEIPRTGRVAPAGASRAYQARGTQQRLEFSSTPRPAPTPFRPTHDLYHTP